MFPISCNAFGDILAIVQLVRNIAAALNDARGAAAEYQRLIHSLNMLSIVIEKAYPIALSCRDESLKDALLKEVRRCAIEDIAEAGKLLPGFETLVQSTASKTSKLARAQIKAKKLQWHFLKASDAATFADRFHAAQLRINTVIGLINFYLVREEMEQSTSHLERSIDSSGSATISAVYESSHEIRQDFSTLRQDITSMTDKFMAAPSQRDNALVGRIFDTFQNQLSSSTPTSAHELERQRFLSSLIPYAIIGIALVSQSNLSPGLRTPALWATIIALLIQVLRLQSAVPTSVWSFSENVIILIDVLGERVPVALQLCVSMQHFHQFLDHYYSIHGRQGADYVRKKSYELYGSDDSQALTFASWSRYIVPGAKIEMGILLRRVSSHRSGVIHCPWCDNEARQDASSNTYSCTSKSCARPFAATKEASTLDQFEQSSPGSSISKEMRDEYTPADVTEPEDGHPEPGSPRSTEEGFGISSAESRTKLPERDVVQHFRRIHVIEMFILMSDPDVPHQADPSTFIPSGITESRGSSMRTQQTPWIGRITLPKMGPDMLVPPYRTGYETSPRPWHDPRSSSPMPVATHTSRWHSTPSPRTPLAVQYPAWLQRAIDSGYRFDPSANRRGAVPPLLSSDNNRSWTQDAQNADYTIDTQRMIIIPPRPSHQHRHLSDISHGNGYSTTSEAAYISTSRQRRGSDAVLHDTTSNSMTPAPRRDGFERIFSSSDLSTGTRSTDARLIGSASQTSQGRPILRIPESQKMDYAIHWQLLPYNPKSGKPRLYFDIRFVPEYASHVRNGKGHSGIPRMELEKRATKKGLADMTFSARDLPIFDIEVHRTDGVRVCDVFERIHENYQLVLTRTEKALHRDRVKRAQSYYEERVRHERALNPAHVDLGMRRIDLLEGNVVFSGCQWCHPCEEYPDGLWTLLFLPPPRHWPASATAPVAAPVSSNSHGTRA